MIPTMLMGINYEVTYHEFPKFPNPKYPEQDDDYERRMSEMFKPIRTPLYEGCPTNNLTSILFVTTLTLGLRPRQGFTRWRAKKEARSHTRYSWECERV